MPLIWENDKAEYFFASDWTGGITLRRLMFLLYGRDAGCTLPREYSASRRHFASV